MTVRDPASTPGTVADQRASRTPSRREGTIMKRPSILIAIVAACLIFGPTGGAFADP